MEQWTFATCLQQFVVVSSGNFQTGFKGVEAGALWKGLEMIADLIITIGNM